MRNNEKNVILKNQNSLKIYFRRRLSNTEKLL